MTLYGYASSTPFTIRRKGADSMPIQMEFDDYEVEVIRHLSELYHNGAQWIDEVNFPRYEEVEQERLYKLIARFTQYDFIEGQTTSSWSILPTVAEVAYKLDNPPPKDHWAGIMTWFRSRWWSVPFFLLVVGLPLVVTWIQMAQTVLEWVLGSE